MFNTFILPDILSPLFPHTVVPHKSNMEEYQENLKTMLSDVDKEVCDLLHYLELNDLDDGEMLKTSRCQAP